MNPFVSPKVNIWAPEAPKRAPKRAKKTQFWAILAHIAQKDLEEFSASGGGGIEKNIFCSKSLLKGPQRVWDPQKPKFCALDPPSGPVWAHFVGKMGQMGVKKRDSFEKIFFVPNHSWKVPGGSGTLKNPKLRLHGLHLGGPVWGHFVGKKGHFEVKKNTIFSKKNLLQITFKGFPEALGPSGTTHTPKCVI